MKILFCCAGGMSTGLLMQKLQKYADQNHLDIQVKATGLGSWEKYWPEYDVLLVGPQVRYAIDKMKQTVTIPVESIEPLVYGRQQVEKIIDQAERLLSENNETK